MGEDTVATEAPGVESGAETNAGVMTVDDLAASFVERVEGEDANEAPESEAAEVPETETAEGDEDSEDGQHPEVTLAVVSEQ